MKTRFKISLTLLALVVAGAALSAGFRLMNEPSDALLGLGMVVVLAVFTVVPTALTRIWRKRHGEQEQKHEEAAGPAAGPGGAG